jgi:hypothetical protein
MDDSIFVAAEFETALFEISLLKKTFGPVIPRHLPNAGITIFAKPISVIV